MSSRRPIDLLAFTVMVVLCLIWGTQQVAIKGVADGMSSLLQVGVRAGLAAVVIAIIAMVKDELSWFSCETWKPGLVVGLLFGIEFVFVGLALRYTSASHVALFLYTGPVFAALGLQSGMREERLSLVQWGGILVAFLGVVVSFAFRDATASVGEYALLGDLFGVLGGAAWGMTTVVIRGSRLSDAPASITLLYQLIGAFVLASGGAVVLGQANVIWSPLLVTSLVYQVLVIAVASYLAWFMLLRAYLASRLGVLSFMTPLFGVTSGVLLLGEALDGAFLVGAVMVVVGILLVSCARNSEFGIRNSEFGIRRRERRRLERRGRGGGGRSRRWRWRWREGGMKDESEVLWGFWASRGGVKKGEGIGHRGTEGAEWGKGEVGWEMF